MAGPRRWRAVADLITIPHDGHGPEDTCPGCPHVSAENTERDALARLFNPIAFEDWPLGNDNEKRDRMQAEAYTAADHLLASDWLSDLRRRERAAGWYAGYSAGNLDGYFGTSDERAKSPYADLDPYRADNLDGERKEREGSK